MTISWLISDHLELKFWTLTQVDTLYNMHCLIFSNSISIDRSDIWNRALLLSFLSSWGGWLSQNYQVSGDNKCTNDAFTLYHKMMF